MRLLIDGYNLLYVSHAPTKRSGVTWLAAARQRLLETLRQELSSGWQAETTVVFDAKDAPQHIPAAQRFGNIEVVFARDHAEADDLLEELIGREISPTKLTVVSSDRRIRRAAKRRKAQICESGTWYDRLLEGEFRSPTTATDSSEGLEAGGRLLPSEAVQRWLAEFGLLGSPETHAAQEAPVSSVGPGVAEERKAKKPRAQPPKPLKQGQPARAKKEIGEVKPTKPARSPVQRRLTPPKAGRQRASRQVEGNLQDPFPKGYGEDVLEEES